MAGYGLIRARAIAVSDIDAPEGGVGVLFDGEKIAMVSPLAQLAVPAELAWSYGSPERGIIAGGFVNGHHHALRPYRFGKTPPMETWLVKARQRKLPSLTEDELYDHTLLGGVLTVRGGGTSLLDHFPVDWKLPDFGVGASARAYATLGLRATMCLTVNDQCRYTYEPDAEFLARLPDDLAKRAQSLYGPFDSKRFFDTWQQLNDEWPYDRGRLRLGFGPSGPQWCSDALLKRCREVANANGGAPIQIHLLESGYQAVYGIKSYGSSAAAHLRDIGFWDGDGASAAHCVWCSEADLALLAQAGVTMVHNPSSNFQLHVGVAPVVAALDNGLCVGIGCDSGGHDLNMDMLEEGRLTRAVQLPDKWAGRGLDSRQILQCMGNGGAGVVGFDPRLGQVVPDGPGDVVVIDDTRIVRNAYGSFGLTTEDLVVSRARSEDVEIVVIAGRPVVVDHNLVTVDEPALLKRVRASLDRFTDSLLRSDSDYKAIEPYILDFYRSWDDELAALATGLGHRNPL